MSLTEPLRVGYVVKRYPRYSETFVVREILAHEAAGLDVEIFALRPPNDTHFQDVIARVRAPVNYLPAEGVKASDFWAALEDTSGILPGLWFALAAARGEDACDVYQAVLLARAVQVKGIHQLHAPFASDAATVTRLGASLAGVPYTFTARAKDIFHASVRPDKLEQKLREAAAVITVSDYNLAYLRQTFGLAAAHVERIYNGLDLDQFVYHPPDDRPPRIVAVGRLVEKKGFNYMIDACALLASRGHQFDCQIIGTGVLEGALRAQIERLKLQSRVELIGPRPQIEVMRHVQGAAVLALPCIVAEDGDRDGLPNVLFEAMALGTPCVSTDVTGIPEIVRDGETGLMVSQRDPLALADAVERLLIDGELRIRLATRARRLIEREFDIRRNAAQRRAVFAAVGRANVAAA